VKPGRARLKGPVAIIGTGVIGASAGLALRSRGSLRTIGWDSRASARNAARKRGALALEASTLRDALSTAKTIVLATPLGAIIKLLPSVIERAAPGSFIIELGAVKGAVAQTASRALRRRPDVAFASAHPMAGSEKAGAVNASATLFADRPFIIVVPPQRAQARAAALAFAFARKLHSNPVVLTAHEHDRLVAATSALPQLASTALALAVRSAAGSRVRPGAGPGYRDTTRLAASPFAIWAPVLVANAPGIWKALRVYERYVTKIREAVGRKDEQALGRIFRQAAAARRRVAGG
jgi:prephenate dehydrogenase